jgi:hypothetical protein
MASSQASPHTHRARAGGANLLPVYKSGVPPQRAAMPLLPGSPPPSAASSSTTASPSASTSAAPRTNGAAPAQDSADSSISTSGAAAVRPEAMQPMSHAWQVTRLHLVRRPRCTPSAGTHRTKSATFGRCGDEAHAPEPGRQSSSPQRALATAQHKPLSRPQGRSLERTADRRGVRPALKVAEPPPRNAPRRLSVEVKKTHVTCR